MNFPVIMITAHGTIERAVEAMKAGAHDFITKPFNPDHVLLVVRKALEREQLKRGMEILEEEVSGRYRLVLGPSTHMNQAAELAPESRTQQSDGLAFGRKRDGKGNFRPGYPPVE